MNRWTRRTFLKGTVGVAACGVLAKVARADVNSQIRVATIGLNGRGKTHVGAFKDNLVALCDCDESVLGRAAAEFEKKYDRKLDTVTDYRKLLERSDIDAVSIATPSHSHSLIAIAAAAAGKHVYCEKPVSQSVWEGRQLVNAARHYDRLIQCGTQARSSAAIQQAVQYVRDGKLGKINYVVGTCYKPRPSIGKLDQPLAIPASVDYDLWCGPAAKVDLYRPEASLRLALGFQHRLRRHRQPGHPSDGRRAMVSRRTGARAARDQHRRPARLRRRGQYAQHADRALRLSHRRFCLKPAVCRSPKRPSRISRSGRVRWTVSWNRRSA